MVDWLPSALTALEISPLLISVPTLPLLLSPVFDPVSVPLLLSVPTVPVEAHRGLD